MRIVRLAGAPVVVRIRRRDEVIVLLPSQTNNHDILSLARLVLSSDELAELERSMPAAVVTLGLSCPDPSDMAEMVAHKVTHR